ncbi:MAG TPA: 50S ribosomal protein L13 [Gammaproteobacteria bacterium]|nr:50S ribosomal protein L13 [Gammaproteobacteria bacterium]
MSAKKAGIQRRWYLIDADDKVLGRMASRIATILRGKHKPIYTPHVDTGDHVIVINASKIRLTGNKRQEKFYAWHSGYPGGFKSILAGKLLAQRPQRVIELAVKGMLPKNKLGRAMLKKLKVYAGPDHPHHAQQPKPLEVEPS